YPNPFNPETNIAFEIPKVQRVELAVFNILGQKIKVLADQVFNAGQHTIKWRGVDDAGQNVSSGIYILHISAGDFVQNRKMILIR
ncbi:MAG: T9SS type A sorting domain-containing protein, partial [Calditrichia bacterium]|nr:T9SS type A sorting domain-containing protein [Calditrichia bacterium]